MKTIQPIPFDNSSFSLGEMTIESAQDTVSLYGSLTITRDKEGLNRLKTLVDYLNKAMEILGENAKNETLPAAITIEAPVMKSNPFAQ